MIRVQILDKNENGVLETDLVDILRLIEDIGCTLRWSVLEIDGILKDGSMWSLPEIEGKMRESQTGIMLDWTNLVEFASEFFQIFDGIFVGCDPDVPPPSEGYAESRILSSCSVYIQTFDISPWIVYLKDDSLVQRFESRFRAVEISDVPSST